MVAVPFYISMHLGQRASQSCHKSHATDDSTTGACAPWFFVFPLAKSNSARHFAEHLARIEAVAAKVQ